MAAALPLILLPPSEGKTPGGDGPPWSAGTMAVDLDDRRRQVATALGRAMRANQATRSSLLGVKGAALASSTDANRSLLTSPTMPAIERYNGVLYGALDAGSLGARARTRLDRSVLIVSGLWGLVAPGDPIPDYKLKMGASLAPTGKLSTWWRPAIDGAIAEVLGARPRRGPVWNLLPNEHDAAWSGPADTAADTTVFSVRFLEPGRGGALVAVSHWNKFLKGALVRFLVEHPGASVDELAAWEHPSGYVLDPDLIVEDGNRVQLRLVKRP
jgi:cytoplasmic iron level regulating protein YaaA (DUF328/UPF0246 family)